MEALWDTSFKPCGQFGRFSKKKRHFTLEGWRINSISETDEMRGKLNANLCCEQRQQH